MMLSPGLNLLGEPPTQFWFISLLLIIPYLIFFYNVFGRSKSHTTGNSNNVALQMTLTVLVVLHTVFIAGRILYPPINVFTYFNLPLSAPVPIIRTALLEYQAQDPYEHYAKGNINILPSSTETLLTRLGSFESRVTYLKYGPTPLALCQHCVYQTDFSLFAISPTVLSYLLTLILTSLLTTSYASGKANWRTPTLFVLGATLFSEVWWVLNTLPPIRDERVKGLTHTHVFILRNIILLLVPLIIHHLPPNSTLSTLPPFVVINRPRPNSNLNNLNLKFNFSSTHGTPPQQNSNALITLNTILNGMGSTLGALRALEWVRAASLRTPELRERIADYHTTLGKNAARVRDDPTMILTARQAGLGYSVPHQNQNNINNDSESDDEDRGGSSSYLYEKDDVFLDQEGEEVSSRWRKQSPSKGVIGNSNEPQTQTKMESPGPPDVGVSQTRNNHTPSNQDPDPDLKLRDMAREAAQQLINTYLRRT